MKQIRMWVEGEPAGQPRHRARAMPRGRKRRGEEQKYIAQIYSGKTKAATAWKSALAYTAKRHRPTEPITGPVEVWIDVYFSRPQRLSRKKDPDHRLWHDCKPDRDNVEKLILDMLTELGFWGDDAQVCAGAVRKYYVAKGASPGALVIVQRPLPAEEIPF